MAKQQKEKFAVTFLVESKNSFFTTVKEFDCEKYDIQREVMEERAEMRKCGFETLSTRIGRPVEINGVMYIPAKLAELSDWLKAPLKRGGFFIPSIQLLPIHTSQIILSLCPENILDS